MKKREERSIESSRGKGKEKEGRDLGMIFTNLGFWHSGFTKRLSTESTAVDRESVVDRGEREESKRRDSFSSGTDNFRNPHLFSKSRLKARQAVLWY